MNHEDFMSEALREAKCAYEKNEVPIGAIIVQHNKIIASAHNLRESQQKTATHAEMLAIHEANEKLGFWRLDDATLYTTVEPCMMCAGTIVQARIKTVVYGAKDLKAGCGGTLYNLLSDNRFNHQCEVISGVMETESQALLSQFFKTLRKQKKKKAANDFILNDS
ncbi:MAG: tRNA adenosine(34) deaminase TadA [Defluviitaleaceae bacterium]|nr:tRNA adenosine(34) deaminase TadA [Defluviitaleaceae bacterium]